MIIDAILLLLAYLLVLALMKNKNKLPYNPDVLKTKRVLFIIKERNVYGSKTKAYGLFNSCQFVANKLKEYGIESKVVQVVDNNDIDREVSLFRPTDCFVEAIWVVPSKFEVLSKLHPTVNWYVRIHSMIPFLSSEGMAFEWINEYQNLRNKGIKISLSCNNEDLYESMKLIYGDSVSYTPNMYFPPYTAPEFDEKRKTKNKPIINIGCFGALRVLKNHTQQAVSAIQYANRTGKTLNFHVNISEHEQAQAGPTLRSLRAIFANTRHNLVEHPWYDHSQFLNVVKDMDLGMQISFTETFNITAADFVFCGVPIIVSKEIKFVNEASRTDPTNEEEIQKTIRTTLENENRAVRINLSLLNRHNDDAVIAWLSFLSN
jgi:hypothetical protein